MSEKRNAALSVAHRFASKHKEEVPTLPSHSSADRMKESQKGERNTFFLKSTVRVGGTRGDPCDLAYEVHGDGHTHKVLFIMGLCMSKELWGPQVRYFAERPEYQVCILDNRGHGESRARTFYASTRTFAWDCYELLIHLKWDHVHVVGLSMGGMIAQELSIILHENRHEVRLASLTLGATHSGGAFGYLVPLVGIPHMIRWVLALTPQQKARHLMPFCYSEAYLREHYPKLFEWHLDIYRDVKLRTLMSHLCAVFGHYVTYERLNIIKESKAPVLVVTGTDDKLVRARNSTVLSSALQTECVVFDGCGHLLNCERANEFNDLLHKHVTGERQMLLAAARASNEALKTQTQQSRLLRLLPSPARRLVTWVWAYFLLLLGTLVSLFFKPFRRTYTLPPKTEVDTLPKTEAAPTKTEAVTPPATDSDDDVPPTQNPTRKENPTARAGHPQEEEDVPVAVVPVVAQKESGQLPAETKKRRSRRKRRNGK